MAGAIRKTFAAAADCPHANMMKCAPKICAAQAEACAMR
jgi:hypothetical protein